MSKSLVSVVTPFRNVASYLPQCIEGILAQSHSDFEYVLSDNGSSDGSTAIAEDFSKRDRRIRLVRQSQSLSQVAHYNSALTQISASSEYCKIVQADDFILPECLERMVLAFEQSAKIGLVSSYYLKGDVLRGSGYPFGATFMNGQEMARFYLRTGTYVFGSPTAVMYRASIIRESKAFFQEGLLHEDTEKCMQILRDWDFGFVHQVLSYLRVENDSISSAWRHFQPDALDWYIIVQRYASTFLDSAEAAEARKSARNTYYKMLRNELIRGRGADFWEYHCSGLKTLGESLDRPRVARGALKEIMWIVANPGLFLLRRKEILRRRLFTSLASMLLRTSTQE
jgi:glycosyltransferase involved in cell wall biosynthesis